ncbi:MAG: hypothetical protein ACP5N7_02360 [Candidatus Pacearchaeota archaeon]
MNLLRTNNKSSCIECVHCSWDYLTQSEFTCDLDEKVIIKDENKVSPDCPLHRF